MGNISPCAAKRRRIATGQSAQASLQSSILRRAGVATSDVSASGTDTDHQPEGSDLYAALSSHGGGGGGYGGGYGHGGTSYGYIAEEECPEGIDEDLALLLTAAAIAAGSFVVFREITLRIKRKKRSSGDDTMGMVLGSVFAGRWEEGKYVLKISLEFILR